MWRCKGCEAAQGEIFRLNERVTDLLDRLAAREGTLGQLVDARAEAAAAIDAAVPPDTPEDEDPVDWRQAELERVALKKGPIQPDFP